MDERLLQALLNLRDSNMETRDWSQLPRAALATLMLQAGQSARHGGNSLALVCSSWADGLAAAVAELTELDLDGCANIDSLRCWLHKHGQQLQLQKLCLCSFNGLSVPPSPNLQTLWLSSCNLDCSAVCTSISTATALTSLHISKCRLVVQSQHDLEAAKAQLLAVLAPLTALQELTWCGVAVHTNHPASASSNLQLPTSILQPMQRLTQLQLDVEHGALADGMVQHIGSMTDLQDLRLGGVEGAPLKLAVTHLTGLTKLRRLGLRGVSLDSGTPAQSAGNAAALLTWLPSLQELSSLQLRAVDHLSAESSEDEALYPPATTYRALTAGSALQHIDLRGTCLNQDAWQRAFPLVRKHTSITSLRFGEHGRHRTQFYFQFTVGSCPNLGELQTTGDRIGTSSWQLLQQHTGLTRLTVRDADWKSFAHISQLTQLERLQLLGLRVWRAQGIHVLLPDLRQLVQLMRLSSMRLDVRDIYRPDMDLAAFEQLCIVFDSVGAAELWEKHQPGGRCAARGIWRIVSKPPPNSPPDVWQQLQAALHMIPEAGGNIVHPCSS